MKMATINNRQMTAIRMLPVDLVFVSDSQDVETIKDYLGSVTDGYDAFFVRINDGDYTEVWGIAGIVPYLSKPASKLL